MFVIPKHETVRDPVTKRAIAPTGAEVPMNGYWMRRVRDKDVVIGEAPAAATPAKAAPTAA